MEQEHPYKRQFGCYEIIWEIENYFAGTCGQKWILHSPDFTVTSPETTHWRFFMKSKTKDERDSVCMGLERLETDPFPDAIRVKWKLSYPSGRLDHFATELKSVFQKKTAVETEINGMEELQQRMQVNKSNTFRVRCRMIVYKIERMKSSFPDDPGLKSLSQDLAVMCRLGRLSDFTLFAGENIFVHKAILSFRNSALNFEIRTLEGDSDTVNLVYDWVDPKVIRSLISFLYTGNLEYVVTFPSFAMIDLVKYFLVKDLESYFKEDKLTIQTCFAMQEFHFKWTTQDISAVKEDRIQSPSWKLESLNTTFRLSLLLKGIGEESDHVAIVGHFADQTRPKELRMECVVRFSEDKFRGLVASFTLEEGKTLGFKKFISKEGLKEFMTNGSLTISCNLMIPTDDAPKLSVVSSKVVGSLVNYNKNEHFEKLSEDMLGVFITGAYSDLTFQTGDVKHKVHRAFLICRSPVFRDLVEKSCLNDTVSIPDVVPHIMKAVLRYVYTGKLKMEDQKHIYNIYEAALKFHILPLQYACSSILKDTMGKHNVEQILCLANKGKDFKLKAAALRYIAVQKQGMPQGDWLHFEEKNSLSKQDEEYIRLYTDKKLTKKSSN